MSSNIPPAGPRQRREADMPAIGDYYIRKRDGLDSLYQVKDVFNATREVVLIACVKGQRVRVHVADLARDWRTP